MMGAALLLLACGPAGAPAAGGAQPSTAPAGPKTLIVAVQEEPESVVLYGRQGVGGTTNAQHERYFIFHGNLTRYDEVGTPVPSAAVKVPTIQDGDWKVNPDGTMDVTWKIRPDAYWHDGSPLTADDFVFGFDVIRDPKLAVAGLGELVNVSSVKAVDPKTLQVSWKLTSFQGGNNSIDGVPAIARHKLETLYRSGDTPGFEATPGWRDEFIGIGPFSLTKLEMGSHIEAAANDRYYLGRPKVDRLIIRWVADVNVTVAQLLSGAIDVVSRGSSLKPVQVAEIRRQWGPEGGQAFSMATDVRQLRLNLKVEGNRWDPSQAGWQRDVRFRQAIFYSINRQEIVETLQEGMTDVAYFLGFPNFPSYKLALERGLPKYEYDPVKGQQLFAVAGWTKGPDGLLRNSGGQTVDFPCCRYASGDSNDIRESLAWGVYLKAMGLAVEHPLPTAPAGLSSTETRKLQTQNWAGSVGHTRVHPPEGMATFTAANIPREETRWSGVNSGAWNNAAYEDLWTKSAITLDPRARVELEFQMIKVIMDELPTLPAYFNPSGVAIKKGVEGFGMGSPFNRGNAYEIHLWDIKN